MKKKSEPQGDLAEQLRAAIRSSALTWRELAAASGVSEPQLSRFLRGERGLSLPSVNALAAALGLCLRKCGAEK